MQVLGTGLPWTDVQPGLSAMARDSQIDSMSQDRRPQEHSLAVADRTVPPEITLSEEDREALRQAVLALEGPSYVARLSAIAGRPVVLLGRALPQVASDVISRATQAALSGALRYALKTIPTEGRDPEARIHKALAILSGAIGGALGVSAVVVELPISTTIMLRSIARIALSEGEDLDNPETALACLQVFALGGRTGSDNLHEAGYFAVRAAMAKSVTRALQQIAGRGVVDESTSGIVRLLAQIGSRFGLVVSQKVAAQAVPVLGAIGGAAVNAAFVDHFQTLARGHFVVRRLERTYGRGTVRRTYNQIREGIQS